MTKIIQITNEKQKSDIAASILNSLPEWFGLPESTKEYIENVKKYPFFAAYIDKVEVGFYSVRHENKDVLDMYVLGVSKKHHRKGIGNLLQTRIETYAKENGYKHLMVLTLAEKVQNKEYLQTHAFYIKQGFINFYQNDDIFDKNNPCQIMIKTI